MSVNRRVIGQHHHFAARHATNHHVAVSGADEDTASNEQVTRLRFLNIDGAAFVEAAREHVRETFGHMLNHYEGNRQVRGDLRKQILKGVRTAGGNADGDGLGLAG